MEPPVPQLLIDTEPAGLPVNLGHMVHWVMEVAPVTLDQVPAGHRAQLPPEVYVPAGQAVPVFLHQDAEGDMEAEVVPAGHAVHSSELGVAEYVLSGQATQVVASADT